ncbi:MAG: hypothetical protein ACR2IM_06435 [Sediminibacterium sp.]
MKLYTELYLKTAMLQSYLAAKITVHNRYDSFESVENDILPQLTPIELPSDEEIVNNACINPITEDFMNDRQIGFVKGCKWMKEQILNQNK